MAKLTLHGAALKCSMGTTQSVLSVSPHRRVAGVNQPVATIQDYGPGTNIEPFGLCTSPANPQVASARSPQPCVPVVTDPWTPGSPSVSFAKERALTSDSTCSCQWGGTIAIAEAGQQSLQATQK
jgi:hypothetical protein